MAVFNKIRIKNFRGIKELELTKFKQFNIIVGNNETGKTSVLEALYISINPGNPNLPVTANIHRGIDTPDNFQFWVSLYKDYNTENLIELDSTLFKTQKIKLKISPITTPPVVTSDNIATDLSNQSASTEYIVQGLRSHFTYDSNNNHAINQNTEIIFSLINPQKPFITKLPEKWKSIINGFYLSIQNTYGQDLATRVGELITLKQEKELVGILQELDSKIKDITLDAASRVVVDYEGLPHRILINSLGEGIYRVTNIITLIYRSRNGVVLIDEVETGLDRKSQIKLMKAIFSAALKYNVQLFFTTHSIELIDALYEVATLEKNEENITLIRLERDDNRMIRPIYFDYQQIQYSRNQGWEIR